MTIGKLKETTWFGAKYVVAPITVPIDVALKLRRNVSVKEIAEEDGKYVLGYLTLTVVGGKLIDAFTTTTMHDFNAAADRVSGGPGKNILLIAETGASDSALKSIQALADPQTSVAVTTLQVSSLSDMVRKLRALPQNRQFDRIDFSFHGSPGHMNFTRSGPAGSFLNEKTANLLKRLKLAAPGAQIRLHSCNVAMNVVGCPIGEDFLKTLGEALLDKSGGQVLAPTKKLSMFSDSPEEFRKMIRQLRWTGLEGPIRTFQLSREAIELLAGGLFWDQRLRKYTALQVDFQPNNSSETNPSCQGSFSHLLHRIK